MGRRNTTDQSPHPTKALLLDTAIELLETHTVDEITSEMVLDHCSVSRGSLYHHFDDLSHLIESALVTQLARNIDESVAVLQIGVETANSVDDVRQFLRGVTRATQTHDRSIRRQQRIIAIARALRSERMLEQLGAEQRRLTEAITNVVRNAQERGWIRAELDPAAVAVLIQSYTLGRIVDDIDPHPVDDDAWIALIDQVMESLLNV